MNWRYIDGTLKEFRGRIVEQLGKFFSSRDLEESGRATLNRGRIQRSAADDSKLSQSKQTPVPPRA